MMNQNSNFLSVLSQAQDVSLTNTNLGNALFADWIMPSTGRRSYNNKSKQQEKNSDPLAMLFPFITQIADNKIAEEFQDKFVYGVEMEILRKGNIKPVHVFLDQNVQSLLWISSKTKAFVFDLTYTTVHRIDVNVEKATQVKDYIVLKYFGEEIPFIFRGNAKNDVITYAQLFQKYISWMKCKNVYPSYFSRILKLYTMEQFRNSLKTKKTISDVIAISELIGLTNNKLNKKIIESIYKSQTNSDLTQKSDIPEQLISKYFKIIHCLQNLIFIFQKYTNKKFTSELEYLDPLMKKSVFGQFLAKEQFQTQESIKDILKDTRDQISFYDFCSYLQSQKSNYAAFAQKVPQNLPLTDYYCYSSHNTYLTGNQLTSDSKIERYIEDLAIGIKCVEIDVHNDGQTPIITHAVSDKSFCKPIDFQETIVEINRWCQEHKSHYPLVISIENHAKEENRYKMLNILTKHFGKKILYLTDLYKNQQIKACAELFYLRGKIIIKTDSKLQEILSYHHGKSNKGSTLMSKLVLSHAFQEKKTFPSDQFQKRYENFTKEFVKEKEKRKNLYDIGIPKILFLPISQMTKVTGLFKSKTGVQNQQSTGYECTSLTNQKVIKSNPQKLIQYTNRSWLRTYPLGTEIASSNYNPVPMMQVGAQIIALNTQTKDDYAWLMMSYFTAGRNTTCQSIGYVDKPLYLRRKEKVETFEKTYVINIVSSTQNVQIKFYGTSNDMKVNSSSKNNTFTVRDHNEGFLLFSIGGGKLKDCIPLRYIRQGYRVLVAKNENYLDSGIRVLIDIQIK